MFYSGSRGGNRGRANRTPPRGLRPRMLPLHHAPPIFQGAEHESLRSQYAGRPATGRVGLFFVAIRVMVANPYIPHVFESGAAVVPFPRDGRVDKPATRRPRAGRRYGAVHVTG